MKHTIIIMITIFLVATANVALQAQEDTSKPKSKSETLTMGPGGIKLTSGDKWLHTNTSWVASGSYYAMTKVDSDDYVYTIPDLRKFYGMGDDTQIVRIAIIFKDSLGAVQTRNMYIPVMQPGYWKSKHTGKNIVYSSAALTTYPEVVIDSSEPVVIHFHPYQDGYKGKDMSKSLRNYKGTIFVYTGVITPNSGGKNGVNKSEGDFDTHWGIVDLGVNTIQDNTNYNSPTVKNFLNVPASRQNSSLLSLRQGKSTNVNIYPFMETLYALKRKNQKINISTGLGLQLYNFRYENPVSFTHAPNSVVLDSVSFKKNKVGFDYLNVPLMVTFKTRLHNDRWLIYGAGITAGYSIATWTKQESGAYGKVKVHDDFGFNNFNSCLTAEIGLSDAIRFYGTYQLTNMFENSTGMNQHPISFGIRFFGI